MNYVEWYPGDYLRDTMRLSLAEHGAFLKLSLSYYAEERPLPADFDEVCRIAGAVTAEERHAVDRVTSRYFPVTDDGMRHNDRIDAEIAKYRARQDGAPAKRSNAAVRQERARAKRAGLFEACRAAGLSPAYNATTTELQAMLRDNERDSHGDVTGDGAGDATATTRQTPRANQIPSDTSQRLEVSEGQKTIGRVEVQRAAMAMRDAGALRAAPTPILVDALLAGATVEQLVTHVRTALSKPSVRDPFAWACARAVEHLKPEAANGTHGSRESAADRAARVNAEHDRREAGGA